MTLKEKARKYAQDQIEYLRKEQLQMVNAGRRLEALAGILSDMPLKVYNRSRISLYAHDGYYTADIYPDVSKNEFTEHDTKLITAWCASKEKFTWKKEPTSSGGWDHVLDRHFGYHHYKITFHRISNIDGCELIEVIETREVKTYKVKC